MTSAPTPSEAERMRTLRSLDILDTSADPTLDALVRTAARVLACPIALVSLVDADRQWFKAAFGVEVRETPRDIAFCAHAIQQSAPLIVPDARRDPRFADNPLVTGAPHVAFYAGVPLLVEAQAVGTLCVIDHRPRELSQEDRDLLVDLARAVEHWLDSRRARQRLADSEQQLRLMAEQTPAIVYRAALDAESSTLYVSPRIRELGYKPEEWVAHPGAWLEALHPEDRPRVLDELAGALRRGDKVHLEYRLRDAEGGWHHIRDVARRVVPPGHDTPVLQGVMVDVTDRVEAEQSEPGLARRLRRREAQLRRLTAALREASEAIFITDLDGKIEYVNRAACTTTGYAASELLGQHTRIFKSGNTPPETYRDLWSQLLSGRTWRGFLFNRRKDGTEYVEFATITPLRDSDGLVANYLAVKEDVTEKRRMSDELERFRHRLDDLVAQRTVELERAREAAEAASAAKSVFLATMSHEIRTPMNGVVGLVDVLQRSSLTPYQKELTDTINESAAALLRVIDDILDFSKIEAGRLDLERSPFDLERIVESTCDALQPLAAARGVELRSHVDPLMKMRRLGDALRLRQVLTNLIGNAIKFSTGLGRSGRVSLRLDAGPDGSVRFSVRDNGIGIDEKVRARLFQPFVQGEHSATRTYDGTGLGLVISQRLAQAMGGTIICDSRVDEGSLFTVELPLAADAGAPPSPSCDLGGLCCHLLLDDADIAADWRAYLAAAGAVVHSWSEWPDGQVLADRREGEPVLVASAARLAGISHNLPPVPVVQVQHGQRRVTRLDHAERVLLDVDNLHRNTLLQAVALAARRAPAPAEPGLAIEPEVVVLEDFEQASAMGRVVLVAEDNEINQKVLVHQLHLLGLACEVASDGIHALERLRENPQRYGVLLTDLHMPRLGGYDLTQAVRQAEHGTRRLPIVALTANALRGEAERCLAAGMDDHLAKPVRLDQLRATLALWLPGAPAQPAPLASAAPADPVPAPQADFDNSVLARLVGDDSAVWTALRRAYLVGAERAVVEVNDAVSRADWSAVSAASHRLKSSSRAVGALALAATFEALELAGEKSNEPTIREVAASLPDALLRLRQLFVHSPAAAAARASPRILVVDDEPFQRRVLMHQLRTLQPMPVETFASGAELLRRVAEVDTSPALLLLDLNMPGMDGVELIRQLATSGFAGAIAPVSGADSRVLDTVLRLAHAWQLRTVGHLHKPVGHDALRDLVSRWRALPPAADRRPARHYSADEIRAALAGEALTLQYQPQVSLSDGTLTGVEALVRWQHPQDGLLGPAAFVPVVESHGLIDMLTMKVLDRALAQARAWRESLGRVVRMAVNVSMDNLSRLDFPDRVLDLLARHGVAPDDLTLEVTETRLMKDVRAPLDILARLRLRGVRLSIDDFGTGHSSLSQLRDLPFSELKIDRGFVHGASSDATQRAILTGSIEIARQLGIPVVAEGVEDPRDWDIVRDLGCHVAQGWYIARAMDVAALEPWLEEWSRRWSGTAALRG